MNEARAYLNSTPIATFQESARLEFQLARDLEFASWFREQYRPLAGGWLY